MRRTSVNMVQPGTLYGTVETRDLRTTKNFHLGGVKSGVSVEIYNVFNTNAVLTENAVYREATPTPRLLKFSLQVDF